MCSPKINKKIKAIKVNYIYIIATKEKYAFKTLYHVKLNVF